MFELEQCVLGNSVKVRTVDMNMRNENSNADPAIVCLTCHVRGSNF